MGPERKSMVIREEERRATAYHEAGHAIVAEILPGTDPVHKGNHHATWLGIRCDLAVA